MKDINLHINPGEFVAVIGKVGSGKSSLLLALMDEMVAYQGSVIKKNGSVAYISQEAFLSNETILENITYAKEFNKARFDRVVEMCQILPDLEILPGKEHTEIGERGANMSGGQKQRISIARALYSDSDIVLIDDALSALDAFVGKKVMENVFLGEMAKKTRVMVTHQIGLLEGKVDRLILVSNGKIIQSGTFEEVKSTKEYHEFAQGSQEENEKIEENNKGESSEAPLKLNNSVKEKIPNQLETQEANGLLDSDNHSLENQDFKKHLLKVGQKEHKSILEEIIEQSGKSSPSIIVQELTFANDLLADDRSNGSEIRTVKKTKAEEKRNLLNAGKLTSQETSESGQVGLSLYFYYFGQAGVVLSILMLFFFAFSVAFKIAADWWIGVWAAGVYENLSDDDYLAILYMFGLASLVFLLLRSIALGLVTQLASVNIFKRILWNILRRPTSFFDTTPSGVIINRCTNDVDQIDYFIPWQMAFFLNVCFNYIGALLLTAVANWVTLVLILIAFFLLSSQFNKYVTTTVELKRLI